MLNKHKSLTAALLLSGSALAATPAYAKSDIETAGDIIAVTIPAIAYGSTYYMDDPEGRQQFYRSFATNAVATYGLKKRLIKIVLITVMMILFLQDIPQSPFKGPALSISVTA